MKSRLTLCLLFAATIALQAQKSAPDSSFFVRLIDGHSLYTNKLQLKTDKTAEQSLLLGDGRTIPIDQVDRFHIRQGTFVALPGSAGTDLYQVQLEGPHISFYSRTFIDPLQVGDSGYTPTTNYFYRKEGQTRMSPATYQGLQLALSDNPASIRQLHIARTNLYIGWGLFAASAITALVGIIETGKQQLAAMPAQPTIPPSPYPQPYPYLPPPSPPTRPATPHHSVSPAVFIGGAGLVAGLTLTLTASHHVKRAFDMYNDVP